MPPLTEKTGALILIVGLALVGLGLLWYVVRAFRTSRGWGIIALVPGLNLSFAIAHFRRAWPPLLVMLGGGLIAASPIVLNKFLGGIDDKAKFVGDTLTLTGAAPGEFDLLKTARHIAVLQWANPAVTDAHLEMIRDFPELRELDLNGTAITDDGLALLATLPKLTTLRLGGTTITDAGFRTHILPLAGLDALDLTGTAVKVGTTREWVNQKPGRKRPSL